MRSIPLLLVLLLGSSIVFAGILWPRLVFGERGTLGEKKAHGQQKARKQFTVYPIGWVRKAEGHTTLVVEEQFEPGLMGLEHCTHVWVLYWFDRNDIPAKRSILQVHPQGNKENPLRGVFATHSPVRPNLIAMSRCKILSVKGNVVEIEEIDALPDTPVLDIKSG